MTTGPEIGRSLLASGITTNVLDSEVDPGGGTVLLIHGSGPGVSAWANWRLTLPDLARDFRVIAPDLTGFGFSERVESSYTLSGWTAHALGVIDALELDQVHVVGNSFGGSIALSLAIHHSSRVRRLGLMGAVGLPFEITPGLDAVWGYEPSVEAMRDLLRIFTATPAPGLDELARLRYDASVRPGVHEAYATMFPAPRQQWVNALAHADEELAAIQSPTIIFHGREDRVIPLETSLRMLHLIPDAQLHVFGNCGHWTQIEHAQDFSRILRPFLLEG
jgi:2-hydroxymuconate-semialdehyde hydrolase